MLRSFSLNLLFDNARFYLTSSYGTPLDSHSDSYECLKDTSNMSSSTTSSSPRIPRHKILSSQASSSSLASPVTTPTVINTSLSLLPFPPSHVSSSPKPDPATPSLLDTSSSFALMMERTGSPASFLTCSSGWDPGILCGAVGFPSLLHSGQSIDNLRLTEGPETDHKARTECSSLAPGAPWAPQPPKVSFSVAAPLYLPPPSREEFSRLQSPNLVATVLPYTPSESLLPSPTNSKYSPASPQSSSPGSVSSLGESTTSSICHDPFYWDKILADLTSSPRWSALLPISQVPPVIQRRDTTGDSLARDSVYSITSPSTIPTIVVLNPDSVMVPTQSSVSSIIEFYDSQRESAREVIKEIQTQEPHAPKEISELEEYEDTTDGEASSPESEFEIVAVPALKVRLDDISEAVGVNIENAFGSLITLGSMLPESPRITTAEDQNFTGPTTHEHGSLSSLMEPSVDVASVFSPGAAVQNDHRVYTSASFASTARLRYAQSGTSVSTSSSWNPTASGSESDCPWLFCVEDGKILEVSRNSSVQGGRKFADKLARFPKVPKSPQMTPLPSPFASPLPSPSPANLQFLDQMFSPPEYPEEKSIGTTTLCVSDAGFLLSPYWGRNATECSTALPIGASGLRQPTIIAESPEIMETNFRKLGVDLGLSDIGSLVSDPFPTKSSYSSGYSTKLSTAQGPTPGHSHHVRFESADFRTSNTTLESARHSPHHKRPSLNRSKTCLKRGNWSGKVQDQRGSCDASAASVRPPGVDCDHLTSTFSSGSISKKGPWWRRGRFSAVIRRVRKGIGGCLTLREDDSFCGSCAWATEHDYWNDHLAKGKYRHPGGPTRDTDGTELLRRVGRYT